MRNLRGKEESWPSLSHEDVTSYWKTKRCWNRRRRRVEWTGRQTVGSLRDRTLRSCRESLTLALRLASRMNASMNKLKVVKHGRQEQSTVDYIRRSKFDYFILSFSKKQGEGGWRTSCVLSVFLAWLIYVLSIWGVRASRGISVKNNLAAWESLVSLHQSRSSSFFQRLIQYSGAPSSWCCLQQQQHSYRLVLSLCLVFLAFEKKKAERYAAIMDEGRLKLFFFLVWY